MHIYGFSSQPRNEPASPQQSLNQTELLLEVFSYSHPSSSISQSEAQGPLGQNHLMLIKHSFKL